MPYRQRASFLILILASVLLGFAACKSDTPSTTEDKETSTSTTAVELKPSEDLTVSARLRAEPDRLNLILTYRAWSLDVCRHIYLGLLEYDRKTLELTPQLVKSLPEVKTIESGPYQGGTSYTFELHDEAVWANGSPMTAMDYIFSLKAMFNPHVASDVYRPYLSLIRDVEVDANNPKRFTVITDQKYIKADYAAGFLIYPRHIYDPEGLLDDYVLSDILNPEKLKTLDDEKLKTFGEQFNSSEYSHDKALIEGGGAYLLEEWQPNQKITLVRKDNWWGNKLADKYPGLAAYPKRLVFYPIPDANSAISMLKSEELDVMAVIPDISFNELKENDFIKSKYDLYTPDYIGYAYLALNTRLPKLADKRVRRALAHLFDVDEVMETVKLGYARPTIGPFHASRDYYHKGLKEIKLNIEKAKQLLNEAGWEDSNGNGIVDKEIEGERVEMEIEYMITPNNSVSSNIALIFQEQAKKGGVGIKVVKKEANKFRADRSKRNFEMFSAGTQQDIDIDDPYQYWHTSSDAPNGANWSGFGNAETDDLIMRMRSTLDQEERKKLYLEFQEILYDFQPYIFMYSAVDRIAIHKRFKNVYPSTKTPHYSISSWVE